MSKSDGESKQNRKELIFRTILTEQAIKEVDLAERLNIGQRTVNNYLRELENERRITKEGLYWQVIDFGSRQLRRIDITPEEGMALWLAARSLAHVQDERNEVVETAFYKLANAIKDDIVLGNVMVQAAQELADRPERTGYNQVFRTLMQAYVYRRTVEIVYKPAKGESFKTTFQPYLFEPSLFGLSIYAIGHSSLVNKLRTYKIERIQSATLTRDEYRIPDDFAGLAILKTGWSGMYGENTQLVRLRFSPAVRNRVLETHWHGTQKTYDDPSLPNYLIWEAHLSEWLDLLPWAKGWGSAVEVLEPLEMRQEIEREIRRMMSVYGLGVKIQNPTITRLLRCWGKTGAGNSFHPAIFHMLDVANVAYVLLDDNAPCRWRQSLAHALNVDEIQLKNWLPYFIALHDIGKISIAFQSQNATQFERMKRENFIFSGWRTDDFIRHEIISRVFIETANLPQNLQCLSEAISGHHGKFVGKEKTKDARNLLRREDITWQEMRQQTDGLLRAVFFTYVPEALIQPSNISTAIMALSGFMVLCDWVGSDERFFKVCSDEGFDDYVIESRNRAIQAVTSVGLLLPVASKVSDDVALLFADLGDLRPLQMAINDIPKDLLEKPTITLIEAPTGEGKTEAALALARCISRINGTDEMFYALPTMATSDQMFGRLQKHLRERLGLNTQVKLAHGQAFLVEDDLCSETPLANIELLSNGDSAKDKEDREIMEWFSGKKRALLAPFGVGTVDQIELAVLNVKHGALRMAGLLGKIVIVDEVHAYDVYMTTIIERLLMWLSEMGTSVILLSATLPLTRRAQLLKAFGATTNLADDKVSLYPSLLVANESTVHHVSTTVWQPNRIISLEMLHWGDNDADVEAKAHWLLTQVADGGCVCWMSNTVKRAQRIFNKLRELNTDDIQLNLLHSQFPLEERQRRESNLSAMYGRKNDTQPRPIKGIVIGTQVLEQSLDLDFDVMASDLAPIDLLLQRAGRLHRHERIRPAMHLTPHLFINFEIDNNETLKLGSDRKIYAPLIVRKTYQALVRQKNRRITLPNDYRVLIEMVYGGPPPSQDDPLYNDWLSLKSKEDMAKAEAAQRLIPAPDARDSFAEIVAKRTELMESENKAGYLIAQTRLGEPSLNIIPLELEGSTIRLADEKIHINAEAPRSTQLFLLRQHLRISNPQAIKAIESQSSTKLFSQSALLEDFYPLWLTSGKAQMQTAKGQILMFTLDPDLGLVIEKINKEGKTLDNHE